MAQKQVFIQPRDIYTNIPGNFALGRKSSGVAMLQYPTTGAGIAANTNLVIGFGVPWEIWNGDDNRSMYLKSVKLNHFISAVSAGVTPIISGNVAFYEVVHSNNIVYAGLSSSPASAAMAQLQDATASAGYITPASAQGQGQALSAAGVAIASLWTSSQYETVFTNDAVYLAESGGQVRPYKPRMFDRAYAVEISASVGASAIWEIYGAVATYED